MTIVYSVQHSDGVFYVPTQDEALRAARDIKVAGDPYVSIQKNVVTDRLSKRRLYCALLNNESWCDSVEEWLTR